LTHQLFPGILEKNSNLLFALKVREFIEMIKVANNNHTSKSDKQSKEEGAGENGFNNHNNDKSMNESTISNSNNNNYNNNNKLDSINESLNDEKMGLNSLDFF
jgi:hypothetical protein